MGTRKLHLGFVVQYSGTFTIKLVTDNDSTFGGVGDGLDHTSFFPKRYSDRRKGQVQVGSFGQVRPLSGIPWSRRPDKLVVVVVCVYVYVCTCVYVYTCLRVYMCVHVCVRTHVCMCTFVYVYRCVRVYVCVRVYMYTCIRVYVTCAHVVYMCGMCMYTCVCVLRFRSGETKRLGVVTYVLSLPSSPHSRWEAPEAPQELGEFGVK